MTSKNLNMDKTKLKPISYLPITAEFIERRIFLIRGQKVMLDSDLAALYRVPTKIFNQAVRRHKHRFPQDFMFQLNEREASVLRSQFVTLEKGRGRYSKYSALVFTEQGVAMLSSVLNSERAIEVNIAIMRAFVQLRKLLSSNKDIIAQIKILKAEQQYQRSDIKRIFFIIEQLLTPRKPKPLPLSPKRPIGFRIN